MSLDLPLSENWVDILVENQGRVNFGEKMNDQRKGILGAVVFDKHAHSEIESWPLPLDDLSGLVWDAGFRAGRPPSIMRPSITRRGPASSTTVS